jgi:hypothetical protein
MMEERLFTMFAKHPILIVVIILVIIAVAAVAYIWRWHIKFVATASRVRRGWLETFKSDHIVVLLDETVANPRACYECIQRGVLLYKYTPEELGCSKRVMLEAAIRTAEKRHEESLGTASNASAALERLRWSTIPVSLENWASSVRDADRTLTGAKNTAEDKRADLAALREYLKNLPSGT